MIKKIKGREHLVIKRSGKLEKYKPKKLKKAINWCTDNNEALTDELFKSLDIKIFNKIKIEKLWDEVIETAANKITEMFPIWDEVAKRAYLLKIYKDNYNYNSDIDSLEYKTVVDKGQSVGLYRKEVFETFTDEEIHELGSFIEKDRDLNFTFIGIVSIMEKYAFSATKSKKLELPQHVYMRLAIEAFWKEDKAIRMDLIKQRYDDLSLFIYTEATPKMVNSLTYDSQMASCVLSSTGDNIESINETDDNLGIFSKHGGGLACDVSNLRASGSSVGKHGGKSAGPVKIIQKFQSTVTTFDQKGKRPGMAVITFPFWHYDVSDMIMLKDAGGSEDKRARKLKYAIKWYNLFSKRIKAGEDLTLFDPKEVPLLNTTWGDEFEKTYVMYENKFGIRKKKMPARDLAFLVAKVRSETGNLYITFIDNINDQRMGELPVFSSNLCQEITIPNFESESFKKEVFTRFGDDKLYTKTESVTGEIGLCNLSSINLDAWYKLTFEQKNKSIYNLLRASDNLIENSFYPVPDGEVSNKTRRPIGIGISNYANFLATNKCKMSDRESLKLTHEMSEDVTYIVLLNSVKLARERGAYKHFKKSWWAKGLFPMDVSMIRDVKELNFDLLHDWESLRKDMKMYGVRFSYHFAIAPTATSGMVINSTEGIDPIRKLLINKEGTYTLPQIVPNLKQNRPYYEIAFDVGNKNILNLGAIRQKFWDQGQSLSLYYKTVDSAFEVVNDILYAEALGMKSLYYLHPMKAGDIEEDCESCSS